jgi:alpha-amylase
MIHNLGQSLESFIPEWFKPIAYSLILLRKEGIPCVFYGDYYGIPSCNIPGIKETLNKLIQIRKYLAYGNQIDYFDDPDVIAWVREGDPEHPCSGLVAILSNKNSGTKEINIGENFSNCCFYDCLRKHSRKSYYR